MSTPDSEETFRDLLELLPSLMLSTTDLQGFLGEVARLAARSVSSADAVSCGITTRHDRGAATLATSDARAAVVDEDQYSAGDGPCLTAMRTASMISVSDVTADTRWPRFRASAAEHGVWCVLSLPLLVDDRALGALNLYGFAGPGGFGPEAVRRASLFADRASTALALTLRHVEQGELTDQLEQALRSNSVIDQALGVLMGEQRCDAETAFALMRRRSQDSNTKLRDVAAELIERVTGHPPGSRAAFERGPGHR